MSGVVTIFFFYKCRDNYGKGTSITKHRFGRNFTPPDKYFRSLCQKFSNVLS